MPLLTAGPSRFLGRGGVAWLLRDEFTTDLAAGAVNGTVAEPGPGTRTLTSNVSGIASGIFNIPASTGDCARYDDVIFATRTAGRMLLFRKTFSSGTNEQGVFGWHNAATAVSTRTGSFGASAGTGSDLAFTSAGGAHTVLDVALNEIYDIALIVRAAGGFIFAKLSAGVWRLLWRDERDVTTSLRAAIGTRNAADCTQAISYVRIPDTLWLPTPLVSDGFASAFGTSDGLGHSEGVATGIGAGGGGVAKSGATWSVSGGKAINTPVTFGAERLTDGAFENWGSATDLTSWTEGLLGTTTINREGANVHGGTYAVRIDVDASNNGSLISQAGAVVANKWYRFSVWAKSEPTGKSLLVGITNNPFANGGFSFSLTNSYSKYTLDRWTNGTTLTLTRSNAASSSVYIDDVSVTELTLSELISSVSASTANVVAGVAVTVVTGRAAGLCLNLDSASSPANFVLAYYDGASVNLVKCVAGVYTSLIFTAATYSAGARLVVTKDDTKYRVYYNNSLVGTEQTIADAGIVSNTLHGLFSTDASNTLDDFVIFARGNEGQYAELDRYSGS